MAWGERNIPNFPGGEEKAAGTGQVCLLRPCECLSTLAGHHSPQGALALQDGWARWAPPAALLPLVLVRAAGLVRVLDPWHSARRGRRCGSSPGPCPGPSCPWERQARTCRYLPWLAEAALGGRRSPMVGVLSPPRAEAGIWQPWFGSVRLGVSGKKLASCWWGSKARTGQPLVIAAGWR